MTPPPSISWFSSTPAGIGFKVNERENYRIFFVFQIGMQPDKVDRVKRKHQKDDPSSNYEFSTNPKNSASCTITSLESAITLSYCAVTSTSTAITSSAKKSLPGAITLTSTAITSSASAINLALGAITSSVSTIDSASDEITSPASGNSLFDYNQNRMIDSTKNSNTTSPPNNDGIAERELATGYKRSLPLEEYDMTITSKAPIISFEDILFPFEGANTHFQDTSRSLISLFNYQVSTQTSCK